MEAVQSWDAQVLLHANDVDDVLSLAGLQLEAELVEEQGKGESIDLPPGLLHPLDSLPLSVQVLLQPLWVAMVSDLSLRVLLLDVHLSMLLKQLLNIERDHDDLIRVEFALAFFELHPLDWIDVRNDDALQHVLDEGHEVRVGRVEIRQRRRRVDH